MTIPRLELSAAVVGTRIGKMMKEELDMKVRRSYFWTDSTCVLTYINKESTRFQEILSKDTGYIYMPYNTRNSHWSSTNSWHRLIPECLTTICCQTRNPEGIRSHNGGNFVSGEKELRKCVKEWNQDKIHQELLLKDIKWIFNPSTASHHGVVWERCIRTVRKVMRALLHEQALDYESLHT